MVDLSQCFVWMITIAFTLSHCMFDTCCQPSHTTNEHDQGCDNTKNRSCENVCTEILHRNCILNLRCTRNSCHCECKSTKSDTSWKETLWNTSFSEKYSADWVNSKCCYEQRYTTICDNCTSKNNS